MAPINQVMHGLNYVDDIAKAISFSTKGACKSKINFGTPIPPRSKIKFGTPTRMEQASQEMTGATLLAEQNKAQVLRESTISFGAPKKRTFVMENIPYTRQGANVTLTYREGIESLEFSPEILKGIKGYTDSNGNVLPYILLDELIILNKGNGLGRAVMEDIKQIARDRCGGRLLLIPSYTSKNPSPFYYKCGLRSTTKEGSDEILAYLNNGTPFKSGSSAPMYLPIE